MPWVFLHFTITHTVFIILSLKLHPSSEDERVQEYHMCILLTYSPIPVKETQKIIIMNLL
jgi:hypothetical protein